MTTATLPTTANENDRAMTTEEIAEMIRCTRRHIERERSAGRFPQPDFNVGRRPRWWTRTVLAYLAGE